MHVVKTRTLETKARTLEAEYKAKARTRSQGHDFLSWPASEDYITGISYFHIHLKSSPFHAVIHLHLISHHFINFNFSIHYLFLWVCLLVKFNKVKVRFLVRVCLTKASFLYWQVLMRGGV